jgi:hypothetical protein
MRHSFAGDNSIAIPPKRDVWFAPALFCTDERKKEHVQIIKAFWLDIDCGKPNTYTDKIEAVTALRNFIDVLGLPEPAVVNSGNGIHVWWVLDRYLTPEQWQPLASALREACVEQNLLADHGITIDSARIMRVPGTHNYKDPKNPKPVELLTEVVLCTPEQIEEAVGAYTFKVEVKKNAKQSNAVFSVDLPTTPKDAERIADQCKQLDGFRGSKGNLSEPIWYAGLGVLALCVDGERLAQEWSSGHPDYSEEATAAKYERAVEFAPTTCAKYGEVNPAGCQGCPFLGKITSPIQLGETVTPLQITEPTPETLAIEPSRTRESDDTEIILPKGYLCGQEGVYLNSIDGEGDVERKIVFTQPVWVSQVAKGEIGGGSEVELSWYDANKKLCRASFKQSLLAVDANIATWLLDQDISDYGNIKVVILYLRMAISAFKQQRGSAIVFDRFGIHDSGFVIGTELITATGKDTARLSQRLDPKRVTKLGSQGTLSEWTRASRLLDRDEFWMHRFTVLGALASPVFALTEHQGSVLSLAGESSGGKTTAANFGVSAFGHPEALTVDPNSTVNAFFEHWRQVNNLPIIVNEAATIRKDRLGEIIYAAANGKARDTSTRDQRINDKGGWRTLTIFTSNVHLMSLPDTVIADAERKRMLELSFNVENKMDIATGKALAEASRKHYGIAGRLLIEYLMRFKDDVVALVDAKVELIQKNIDPAYRFGIWQIGANAVIGEIASRLGLIQFETSDAIANALAGLQERSRSTVDPITKVRQMLDDYTNRFQESIGQREASNRGWYKEPRGEARGKWKMLGATPVELCIAITLFNAYALEQGLDANYVRQWIKANDIPTKTERLAESANAVKCYVIPADKVSYGD